MCVYGIRIYTYFCLSLFNHRHVGALGNIEADANGTATVNIVDRMVKLHGPISVDGRAIVVCRYCATQLHNYTSYFC